MADGIEIGTDAEGAFPEIADYSIGEALTSGFKGGRSEKQYSAEVGTARIAVEGIFWERIGRAGWHI
jgi:hypothetical protein